MFVIRERLYAHPVLQTEISDSNMLKGNVTISTFYLFILHLIVYQVQCCARTRLDTHTHTHTHTHLLLHASFEAR